MSLVESLKRTEETLKLDVDGTFPQWFILMRIFNFLHLLPCAKLTRSSSLRGYHLFASTPSSLHMRRTLRDDLGRIYMTEKRKEMIGVGGDIIYRRKGVFQITHNNGSLIVRWTRPLKGDEPCNLRDILRLPFTLKNQPTHVKRTIRYKRGKNSKHKMRNRNE